MDEASTIEEELEEEFEMTEGGDNVDWVVNQATAIL